MVDIAIILSITLLVCAITAFSYVSYRFFYLIIKIDRAISREILYPSKTSNRESSENKDPFQYNQPVQSHNPTDGGFEFNTDEELYLAEQVRNLRAVTGAMSAEDEEELQKIVRQSETKE